MCVDLLERGERERGEKERERREKEREEREKERERREEREGESLISMRTMSQYLLHNKFLVRKPF